MRLRTFTAANLALAMLIAAGFSTPRDAWSAATKGTKGHLYGDAERGRDIAAKWCVSCHAVRSANENDQIPTFAAIAAGPMGEPGVLRAFLNAPHKPMPPLQLTNQEIEDLVTFIRRQK